MVSISCLMSDISCSFSGLKGIAEHNDVVIITFGHCFCWFVCIFVTVIVIGVVLL